MSSLIVFLLMLVPLAMSGEPTCSREMSQKFPDFEDCRGYYACNGNGFGHHVCDYGTKFDYEAQACVPGKCPPCSCSSGSTTEPTLPPTHPTEPTDPTLPPTHPTEPTDPTRPPTHPTEPTDPTLPPTHPTEPTDPTRPPTHPTEPTDPTRPPTDPTDPTRPTEPTNPPTYTTDPSYGTDTTTVTSDPNPNPETGCLGKPDGAFFRDQDDCNKYYVCRVNEAVEHRCQYGLWFDDKNFVCNFPSLVKCPAGKPKY